MQLQVLQGPQLYRNMVIPHTQKYANAARWVKRLSKSEHKVTKAVAAAKSIAHSHAAASQTEETEEIRRRQLITGRIRSLPMIQQPDEMFNSAMKDVRKLRPLDTIQKKSDRSANLVRLVYLLH